MFETREKHAHETNTGEIGNTAKSPLILCYGNAELISSDIFARAITQRSRRFPLIYDKVSAHHHVCRAKRDVILIVFLIFVERVILIDIFHIGRRFVRRIIALAARIAIGRIALRVINVLIAVQNGDGRAVVVRAAEIMIVIIGGVGLDRIEHGRAHPCLNRCEKGLIR